MITRRRFLTHASALAVATLGAAEALAQGGGLAQSGLVGTLEGSQVVTDAAAIPKSFKEAPELAELVQARQAASGGAAPAGGAAGAQAA